MSSPQVTAALASAREAFDAGAFTVAADGTFAVTKHAGTGGTITVAARNLPGEGGLVEVTVRDTGFQMASVPVGTVFDPKQFTPARLAEVEARFEVALRQGGIELYRYSLEAEEAGGVQGAHGPDLLDDRIVRRKALCPGGRGGGEQHGQQPQPDHASHHGTPGNERNRHAARDPLSS